MPRVPELVQRCESRTPGGARASLCAGAGPLSARLVNGVFGDPLLEIRVRDRALRVLLDLGDASLLSRRVLHRISDVFITHAHFDHVCGFLSLLRARMTGPFPACRIYGPPGIQEHIAGFVAGFCWDRIEDAGPEFLIGEIHERQICWWRIKVGQTMSAGDAEPIHDGVILTTPDFQVRCAVLDHGIPVLCYAVESSPEFHVRQGRLEALGLVPGPWIRELKRQLRVGNDSATIRIAEDREERVHRLREALLQSVPGKRLVYATDFADTPRNRATLTEFARDADLLFCEATFCLADRGQASATQHLTTRACGEIARAAGVRRLAPFHFSKRYTHSVSKLYAELEACLRA